MAEEQMDLIDVHGVDVKPCLAMGRKYRAMIDKRLNIQKKEAVLLEELIEAIYAAKLKPLEDGLIHFEHEGVEILLTPGKAKVKVVIKD